MGKLELDKTNISLWGCACQDRVDGNKNLEEAPTYLPQNVEVPDG